MIRKGRGCVHQRDVSMSIETPCVNLCVLDGVTGLCVGCGRTGDEIAHWLILSPTERTALLAQLPARLDNMVKRDIRGRSKRKPANEAGR